MASTPPAPTPPAQTPSAPASATRGPGGRSTSTERAQQLAFLLGLVLLETIPVAAWLETGATLQVGDPNQTALPFWLLVLVMLLAALISRASARMRPIAALLVGAPVYLVCLIVAVRISPSAYGPVAEGPFGTEWILALGTDLFNGTARTGAVFGLAVVLAYLWWRGLYRGRRNTTAESTRNLFFLSFAATVAAVAFAALVRGAGQAALAGRLEFLLLLDVFAGLAALAIVRVSKLADDRRSVVWTGSEERGRWVWLGLIIAASTLLLAALLTLVVSYDTVIAALRDLGPVGALLDAGLEWLLYGFAYVLFFVLGPLVDWVNGRSLGSKTITVPQPTTPKGACPNLNCTPNVPPAQGIAVAIFLGVALVVLIVVLLYIVYRAVRSMREVATSLQQAEERESLDARGLLGAQLRGLFAGLRRGPAQQEEALDPQSVRAAYRDVLRAAAAANLPRASFETPDEYERRLSRAIGEDAAAEGADDLAALTQAYDRSRYGEQEPPAAERGGLLARGRRLIARLRARTEPGARGA